VISGRFALEQSQHPGVNDINSRKLKATRFEGKETPRDLVGKKVGVMAKCLVKVTLREQAAKTETERTKTLTNDENQSAQHPIRSTPQDKFVPKAIAWRAPTSGDDLHPADQRPC
jgi:hypothetical protein